MATPKIPAKQLVEMAEKAASKGSAETDVFLELLGRQSKKVRIEFEELLERTEWKPKAQRVKDDAERVMDEILAKVGKKKPKPPAPSKPEPVLTREPAPKPQTKPKTAPKLDPTRKRKTGEETKEKGILTLQAAANSVRAILASGQAKALAIAEMVPILGLAIGITEWVRGVPDDEAIISLMRRQILSMGNKRKRERLAVPERYPNGTVKRDIMRRVPGTSGLPRAIPSTKPEDAPKPKKKRSSEPLVP